mgnify:CR=1 FL=1
MHKTPFLHARRIFPAIAAAVLLLALAGCNFTITNLTPDTVPANPSQIYTITASFRPDSSQIDRDSIEPRIIIDGTSHKMTRSTMGADIWEFDYQIPAGRASASRAPSPTVSGTSSTCPAGVSAASGRARRS